MKSFLLSILKTLLAPWGYEIHRPHPQERPWLEDAEFIHLFDEIKNHTVVRIDRLFSLYQLGKHARTLPGDMAEVGVYKGGTARLWIRLTESTPKAVHLFDTFEGMPGSDTLGPFGEQRETFLDTSLKAVQEFVSGEGRAHFHPGIFPSTVTGFQTKRFSLVYLDADLYETTKAGLEFFWPRMVPGGVVIVDDYGSRHWHGIKKAADEFSREQGAALLRTAPFQCAFLKG